MGYYLKVVSMRGIRVPPQSDSQHWFPINVGPLSSLGSFSMHAGPRLKDFSDLYRRGRTPKVLWDFRNLEARRVNLLSLTSLLSIADRLRAFTGEPGSADFGWNPSVLSFLTSVEFTRIAENLDLWRTVSPSVGGVSFTGRKGQESQILVFPVREPRPWTLEKPDRILWKDLTRQDLKNQFELHCGPLFRPRGSHHPYVARELSHQLAITTAELVVNSLLWGRSTAFVGIQRTHVGVTVAVCDAGIGFLTSLLEKGDGPTHLSPGNHADAIVEASMANEKEFGLFRAIQEITRHGGWVSMSSFDAEIHWTLHAWAKAASVQREPRGGSPSPKHNELFRRWSRTSDFDAHTEGWFRVAPPGLRGTRVAFELRWGR